MKKKTYSESSGNVFLDIGFSKPDAENLLVRADLMGHLCDVVRKRKLTQAKAAQLLGATQPRISDLMRGKIERFSVDMLIAMLGRAGAKIKLHVRAA